MRATQSATTVLDGALRPAPTGSTGRCRPGPSADPFVFALFAVFEILLAAVYTGIGRRAIELGVEAARRRTSMKHDGRAYAQDPDIRWRIADAALAQDGAELQVVRPRAGRRRAGRPRRALVRAARRAQGPRDRSRARVVVDHAIRVSGGGSYFSGSELGRLYRDVLAGHLPPVRRRVRARDASRRRCWARRRPDVELPDRLVLPLPGTRLRALREDDWPLDQALSRVADVPRWTYYPADLGVDDGPRAGGAEPRRSALTGRGGRFVVEHAGAAVGTVGLVLRVDGPSVYYAFLPAGRGMGLATEAVRAADAAGRWSTAPTRCTRRRWSATPPASGCSSVRVPPRGHSTWSPTACRCRRWSLPGEPQPTVE